MSWSEWFTSLFDAENERNSYQFFLSLIVCGLGSLASIGGLVAWGTKLMISPTVMVGTPPAPVMADIPPNLTALLQAFVIQTIGGLAGAILYKPKASPLAEPKPPGGPTV